MNGTDYTFVRKLIAGSVNLTGLGPLNLRVPKGKLRRHIYAAVVWQGFVDWYSEGILEMVSGGSSLETFRTRWGNAFDGSAGSSQTTWDAADNGTGWRRSSTGWPTSKVSTYPPANYPNGIVGEANSDSIMFSSLQKPDGTNLEAVSCVMQPMIYIGDIEAVRFQFFSSSITTVDPSPTVEVYLGCKTFTN